MNQLETEPKLEPGTTTQVEDVNLETALPQLSFFQSHPSVRWILPLMLIICGAISVGLWRYYSVRETTDDAQIDGHLTTISARVGGTVADVNFDDQQIVQQGQRLVQIDPRDYDVALQRANAELADATHGALAAQTTIPLTATNTASTLANAEGALASVQKQAGAADAKVREAEANHTRSAQDLQRMNELIAHDEISRQQYDNAVATESAARAALDAAHAAAAAVHSQVAQAQAQVRAAQTAPEQIAITRARAGSAQAMVEQRQAALQRARLDLDYTVVKAPINGIAGGRNVQPGQVIQAGQPLLALVDLDNLWCIANFKETQLEHMRPGQQAKVHVDAFNADYKAHIESFGGATGSKFSVLPPENATGNFVKVVQRVPVKVAFDPGQDVKRLRPGMSVVITVITK